MEVDCSDAAAAKVVDCSDAAAAKVADCSDAAMEVDGHRHHCRCVRLRSAAVAAVLPTAVRLPPLRTHTHAA
jgi:hypothetical protein